MEEGAALGSAEFSGEVSWQFKPVYATLPQEEVDAAYSQLAEMTGEPVDAVTPYGPDLEDHKSPDMVIDPVAVQVIKSKEDRMARALATIRPSRRTSRETIEQIRSERKDFHTGINRAKKVAKKLGQSVTAAARDYRERGTWRRGRAPSREHPVRRLPREALATQN